MSSPSEQLDPGCHGQVNIEDPLRTFWVSASPCSSLLTRTLSKTPWPGLVSLGRRPGRDFRHSDFEPGSLPFCQTLVC